MSSLIMHICISNVIKNKYNLSNYFLLGILLPDIYKLFPDTHRRVTHFIKEVIINDEIKGIIEIERFINEYYKKVKDGSKEEYEIFLGYLAHLQEDIIWFDEYIDRYKKQSIKKYHEKDYLKNVFVQVYKEYPIADRTLMAKCNISAEELKELKKDIIELALKSSLLKKEEVAKLIENNLFLHDVEENVIQEYITNEDMSEYYNRALKQTDNIVFKYLVDNNLYNIKK